MTKEQWQEDLFVEFVELEESIAVFVKSNSRLKPSQVREEKLFFKNTFYKFI